MNRKIVPPSWGIPSVHMPLQEVYRITETSLIYGTAKQSLEHLGIRIRIHLPPHGEEGSNPESAKWLTCTLECHELKLSGTGGTSIQHIVAGCKIGAGEAYRERHNQVASIVYSNIWAAYGLKVTKTQWETPPKSCGLQIPDRQAAAGQSSRHSGG